jgi:hypothetical protein
MRFHPAILAAATTEWPFANPSAVTPGFEAGTPTSVVSNEVTTAIGDRVILMFSQIRGSAGTPSVNQTVSAIDGNDDFTPVDETDFTAHAALVQRDDADEGGVGVYIYSWVATIAGTGTFRVTWSGSVWGTLAEAQVVPQCAVIDAKSAGANDAATSVATTFDATPQSADLIFSIAQQRLNAAFSSPTSFTDLSNESGATNHRVRTAYRNGGAGATTTWSGMSGSHPLVAAAIQLRRA